MAQVSQATQSSGGCFRKILYGFSLIGLSGILVLLVMMSQPQDLSDLELRSQASEKVTARDLKAVLESSIERKYALTLTEKEINRWLADTMLPQQKGLLAGHVKFNSVCVRLEDEIAEVIMKRTIFGYSTTLSMFIQIQQTQGERGRRTEVMLHGGPFQEALPYLKRGGRFGRLVVPQGYLILVKSSFEELAKVCKPEIHLGFEEMVTIKIEKNRLLLDPRLPDDDGGGALSF